VPRDGVWGLDGRPTALTALAGDGVQVDGVRVALSDLAALAELDLAAPADAHLRTDGALEATAELEHDTLPRAGGETRVVVRVRANPVATAPRGRLRVHLVIDRSSSMQRTWERVLASARLLIERLQPDDELQIVAYGSDAIEAWPAQRVGDGRAAIRALEDIAVGGGTNVEAGLRLAYDRASTSDARSLCILLSDGVPNHGAFEPSELGGLAAAARQRGVVTSVIGLGTEFDARLLRAVARHGQGGYHVSADVEGLAGGLVSELEAHARAAARQVSVRVRVPEGAQVLGVEGDAGASITGESALLELPGMDVGETRNLVVRVRVPAGTQARSVASVELGYRSGLGGVVRAEKSLSLSFGPRAAVAGGAATGAILNADLSASLDAAAAAVLHGDADAARAALLDHAALAEGRVEHRSSERLQARARVVRRVAAAVDALVPGASHGQRRQVSLSFGDLAARFGR
ncbi:MAG: VWA domain-containing protein, partial [Myxococcota bacterium]|nr:VWA domain-containing protein [Myxococcota bacterium]